MIDPLLWNASDKSLLPTTFLEQYYPIIHSNSCANEQTADQLSNLGVLCVPRDPRGGSRLVDSGAGCLVGRRNAQTNILGFVLWSLVPCVSLRLVRLSHYIGETD